MLPGRWLGNLAAGWPTRCFSRCFSAVQARVGRVTTAKSPNSSASCAWTRSMLAVVTLKTSSSSRPRVAPPVESPMSATPRIGRSNSLPRKTRSCFRTSRPRRSAERAAAGTRRAPSKCSSSFASRRASFAGTNGRCCAACPVVRLCPADTQASSSVLATG